MSSGPGHRPIGQAGWLGLAGIILFAFSFPTFYVSTYLLDAVGVIVFVALLLLAFGLVLLGLRRSR